MLLKLVELHYRRNTPDITGVEHRVQVKLSHVNRELLNQLSQQAKGCCQVDLEEHLDLLLALQPDTGGIADGSAHCLANIGIGTQEDTVTLPHTEGWVIGQPNVLMQPNRVPNTHTLQKCVGEIKLERKSGQNQTDKKSMDLLVRGKNRRQSQICHINL